MHYISIVIGLLFIGSNCVDAKRPDYIQKCAVGDKKCIIKNMNTIFKTKFKGDDVFGLAELDPLDINTIDIVADPKNPVRIDLKYKNTKLLGGKNGKTTKIKGFGKNPTGHHDVLVENEKLTILGDYKANGQVLILPVQGDGKSNLTIINSKIKIGIDGEEMLKDGVVYMNVKSTTIAMECERIVMHFTGLFNDDKALGDNFNMFINQNWREIFTDIKGPFFDEINKHIFKIVKGVFDETPYSEIFEI